MEDYLQDYLLRNLLQQNLHQNLLLAAAQPNIGAKLREDDQEVCCPLPFPLQDLSLLVVMSNLDSYGRELLASLPLWLRRRLLSILPAFDLCRLEHTSVAAGVDVDEIWKSRQMPVPKYGIEGHTGNQFQLKICYSSSYTSYLGLTKEEMESAFSKINQSDVSNGKEAVLLCASELLGKLSGKTTTNLSESIRKLISIDTGLVFSNLLSGSMHEECKNSTCGQSVWKMQATALTMHDTPQDYIYRVSGKLHLTPEHRQLTSYEHDPLKMLSYLTSECNLQPSSVHVDIDYIFKSLCSERLTLDSGSSLPSDKLSCTSIVNQILSKATILSLSCSDYSTLGVLLGIVEAALENSQLKYLFCSMPNLYLDIVQPFSTLISLQNIHQLTLKVDKVAPTILCKLLYEFMTVPCSHSQKLVIDIQRAAELLPTSLEPDQLAGLYKGECLPVPSCSAEHKGLKLSPCAFYLLLRFPIIRLKKISLSNLDLLHLCSLHPNLQTKKLIIDIPLTSTNKSSSSFATIRADFLSLFGMPSLQKIVISGKWGHLKEVKLGLVEGFKRRSCLPPLQKVVLELSSSDHYKMKEFEALCNSIFSLPNLENLRLVLGKGFAGMIQQSRYEEILYESWTKSSQVQLKSICLQTHKVKLERLSLITQEELTFSPKARKPENNIRHFFDNDYDYDDLWSGGSYDSDHYGYGYGYGYNSYYDSDNYYSD